MQDVLMDGRWFQLVPWTVGLNLTCSRISLALCFNSQGVTFMLLSESRPKKLHIYVSKVAAC